MSALNVALHSASDDAIDPDALEAAKDKLYEQAEQLLSQRIGDAIVLARARNTLAEGICIDLTAYGHEIRVAGKKVLRTLEDLGWTVIRNVQGPRTLMLHNENSLERERNAGLWDAF